MTIKIKIEINEVIAVTESDSSFKLDFFFYQIWTDDRLNTDFSSSQLVLSSLWSMILWIPDIYFHNGIAVSTLTIINPIDYLIVDKNKTITRVTRMTGQFECTMALANYPQDTQFCSIEIVSRKYI